MANFRSRGIKHAELTAHLAELDDDRPTDEAGYEQEPEDDEHARKEVAWLRKEVADLYEQLAALRAPASNSPRSHVTGAQWLKVGLAAATTLVLGKTFERFLARRRLP